VISTLTTITTIQHFKFFDLLILFFKYDKMIRKHIENVTVSLRKLIYNSNITTLDTYQLAFIVTNLCNSKLYGVPGGGKTTCIIHKILCNRYYGIINDDKKFLVLMFNRDARFSFIRKGSKISNDDFFFNKRNVRTFHSLAGSICYNNNNDNNKENNGIDTVIISAYNLVVENSQILYKVPCLASCKVIFVDEAQDMTEYQYKLIKTISNNLKIPLILIGDPNQSIYQFGGSINKYFKEHKGLCFELHYNYRSTVNIINFINHFVPDVPTTILSSANKIGKKPLIVIDKIEYILQHIINEIINYKDDISNIAIIGPVKKSHPSYMYNQYGNIGLQLLVNCLDERKIKFVKRYRFGKEYDSGRINTTKKGCVNLLTIHTAKGLEFKKVLLLNFHHETFGIPPSEDSYNLFKYMWYVGISRSIEELILYTDKYKNVWPGLKNCPKKLYLSNISKISFEKICFSNFTSSYISVTDFNEKLTENEINLFEKIKLNIKKENLFEVDLKNNISDDEYSMLIGKIIESIFFYYIHLITDSVTNFIGYMKTRVNNLYEVKKEDKAVIKKIRKYISIKGVIYPMLYNDVKKGIIKDQDIIIFVNKVYDKCEKNKSIKLISKNKVMYINLIYANKLCENLYIEPLESIFKLELYFINIEQESKNILNTNHDKMFILLKRYAEQVIYEKIVKSKLIRTIIYKKFTIQKEGFLTIGETTLTGNIDLLTSEEIIEVKYIREITVKTLLQTIIYYYMILKTNDSSLLRQLYVLNIRTGIMYNINILSKYEIVIETITKMLTSIKDRN
jgi:hypothetical protein